MCGIVGIVGYPAPLGDTAIKMAASIRHRGPDSLNVWVDEATQVAFGHTRLAVVDLSPAGAQPMHSASGRYVITYNGELYNTSQLLAKLQTAQIQWRGHSDTEVLLACIEQWGLEKALDAISGMFAFALWDRDQRVLHLARDRLGEKPLYYGYVGRSFVFASELKPFVSLERFDAQIDRAALASYMRFGYVPAPHSIFRDVRKLPAGFTLALPLPALRALTSPTPRQYWNIRDIATKGLNEPIADETEAVTLLDRTLRDAIASQMNADVPLGAFLSGGVDSSAIVALMQVQSARPVQTFTVGFDEAGYDESKHAAAVAAHCGTDHHEIRINAKEALDTVPRIPLLYDEPFADNSQIATHLICKAARRHVTVALSGDAGDELFGGYNRYFWSRQIWNVARLSPSYIRRAVASCMRAIPISAWDATPGLARMSRAGDRMHKIATLLHESNNLEDVYRSLVTHWGAESNVVLNATPYRSIIDGHWDGESPNDGQLRMMLWDTMTYLPDDILVKVDRAAMGTSLETRAPFLDPTVVELAWRLPISMKIRGNTGKWALRQVLYKYVPQQLIERPKAGFAVPVGPWLRGDLREWAEELLSERRLSCEGYLSASTIRRKWAEHLSGRRDWSGQLWAVLMFQAWLESAASKGLSHSLV